MEDKRNVRRLRKRMTLRFGIEAPVRLAFTEDLSATGLFIKTTNICPPGSKVIVEIALDDSLDDTRLIKLECRVMWAKKVPPQMIHLVKKSGMGVKILRIIEGEARFRQFCEDLAIIR